MTQEMEALAFEGDEGVELTDEEAEESARLYDEAQVPANRADRKDRNPAAPLDQMLMYPCSQAAKAAAEAAAKAADEAEPKGDVVKQEKVKKTAQPYKNRTLLQSCCSQRAALLACAQDQPTETKEKKADAANTQSTKICVDYEPCKKTVGCSRMCKAGKKHPGMCVVGGKALKPDKMQTEDDEPKAGADDVLGADRVLRERKHPMQKFLEDAESSLNTPQPETPPLLISGPNRLGTAICSTQVPRDAREVVFKHACMCNAANSSLSQLVDKWNSKVFAVAANVPVVPTIDYIERKHSGLSESTLKHVRGGRKLMFKAAHFSGAIILVEEGGVTCFKAPCFHSNGTRLTGRVSGLSTSRSIAILQSSCDQWLQQDYVTDTAIERPLYQHARRGCLLEPALNIFGDIKVFCFHGKCPFAKVVINSQKGYFTMPNWHWLATYTSPHPRFRNGNQMLLSVQPPLFGSRLLKHAEQLSAGLIHVRVDFLWHDGTYTFNEMTFASAGCKQGLWVPGTLSRLYGQLAFFPSHTNQDLEHLEELQLGLISDWNRTHRLTCPTVGRMAWHCRWQPRALCRPAP